LHYFDRSLIEILIQTGHHGNVAYQTVGRNRHEKSYGGALYYLFLLCVGSIDGLWLAV
jgi:hypothetical protein